MVSCHLIQILEDTRASVTCLPRLGSSPTHFLGSKFTFVPSSAQALLLCVSPQSISLVILSWRLSFKQASYNNITIRAPSPPRPAASLILPFLWGESANFSLFFLSIGTSLPFHFSLGKSPPSTSDRCLLLLPLKYSFCYY